MIVIVSFKGSKKQSLSSRKMTMLQSLVHIFPFIGGFGRMDEGVICNCWLVKKFLI